MLASLSSSSGVRVALKRSLAAMSSVAEGKLAALGLVLPPPAKSVGSYIMSSRVGNLIYTGASLPC